MHPVCCACLYTIDSATVCKARADVCVVQLALLSSSGIVVHASVAVAGDSKSKPRTFISTPASVSLAVKNNQGVQAGQGCLQPGAWRGCKKSAW